RTGGRWCGRGLPLSGEGIGMMKIYEFMIVASGLDPEAEDFETRFYDAGCNDATVAFQQGHIIVDFAREAESREAAVSSALRDVRAAGASIGQVCRSTSC